MELEFLDLARQETVTNFWTESVSQLEMRMKVYNNNQDLLTIKQKDFSSEGRLFVELECRSQRLIEKFCHVCRKTDLEKSKLGSLANELNKEL